MDKTKALNLEKELKGKSIDGYQVVEFINNGKSAAVFKAKKGDLFYALKIFDHELIERFGHEIQITRIQQEISLKNHVIPNLIRIFEGGSTYLDGFSYYYLVMQFIDGINLKEFIQKRNYGEQFIIKVLDNLFQTTELLLSEKQIAHRDIKPENIMVSSDNQIILMDLGVLKLIGAKSFSDEEEKQFVGTLRYAPPEFLRREEVDSVDGWRSINLYQIGATVHDLIMKVELFHEITPYTNLVIAIKDDNPIISNQDYSFELLQITRDLLSKDPNIRIKLCSKSRIEAVINNKDDNKNGIEKKIDDLLKMRLGHQVRFDEIDKLKRTKQEINKRQDEMFLGLSGCIDSCFKIIFEKKICNTTSKSPNFSFSEDRSQTDVAYRNWIYELSGDLQMGYPRSLMILVRISVDSFNYVKIDLLGIFPYSSSKVDVSEPQSLFSTLFSSQNSLNGFRVKGMVNVSVHQFKTLNIFQGNINLDEGFKLHICEKLIGLIYKSLTLNEVVKMVEDEIAWQEKLAKSSQRINIRSIFQPKPILINSL